MVKERNQNIEALRGIAIIFIVVFHFLFRYFEIYDLEPLCNNIIVNNFGTLGVGLFLTVSGLFLVSDRDSGKFFKPLLRKFLRLWPTYFCCVTLIFLVTRFLPLEGRTVSFGTYIINVTMLNGFVGVSYVDTAHWYLTTILAVYFVNAIILKARKSEMYYPYYIWIILSIACEIVGDTCISGSFLSKIIHGISLLIGGSRIGFVVIGIMIMRAKKKGFTMKQLALCCFSVLHILICNDVIMATEAILIIPVIIYGLYAEGGCLSNQLLVALGKSSYSIFLIHQNLGYILMTYLRSNVNISYWFCSMLAVCFSFIAGALINKSIEIPCQKVAKRLIH